ncbi:SH3 domain-containing protein [Sphingomonas sp. MMS12-HWE2-04]|uniref:SH3 domain-containing protein n=1 Tax=Sphingomonas sp. MMS12-HWE2-04 TaxID=3234199 RepID=UPI00384C028E
MFAPHYAAPMPRAVAGPSPLRAASKADSEVLAELAAGESFEVLEFAGNWAWGIAPAHNLVGYLDASALMELAA